ncbi:MAG TPA: hypothetical protein VGN24_00190 [Rhodanobacter sp.]|jgi:hypothetical protein|nr:hypothetical protein [Rhodanobacter sp.]
MRNIPLQSGNYTFLSRYSPAIALDSAVSEGQAGRLIGAFPNTAYQHMKRCAAVLSSCPDVMT